MSLRAKVSDWFLRRGNRAMPHRLSARLTNRDASDERQGRLRLPILVTDATAAERSGTCAACQHWNGDRCQHPDARTRCQGGRGVIASYRLACARCPLGKWHQWVPAAVVIGSYYWPGAVELNVAAIRAANGPHVPILISDDCSPGHPCARLPGTQWRRLQDIASRYPNVDLQGNAYNIGHAGGDAQAFRKGLLWAQERGAAFLVKLSQRMILHAQHWLADAVVAFAHSGLATGGVGGLTDAVIMRVDRWAPIARERMPAEHSPIHQPAEPWFWGLHHEAGFGELWQWPLVTFDRGARALGVVGRAPPGVLWHDASAPEDYIGLAQALSVDLGAEFRVDGSHLLPRYSGG